MIDVDLMAFLTVRLAEDEASAEVHRTMIGADSDVARRISREVEAKRRIIAEHSPVDPCDAHDASLRSVPCDTLLALAAIYRDSPGYREEWLS